MSYQNILYHHPSGHGQTEQNRSNWMKSAMIEDRFKCKFKERCDMNQLVYVDNVSEIR